MEASKPIIFFDGVCGLCNRFIDRVLSHDRDAQFMLAALQGQTAARLVPAYTSNLSSIVLWEQGRVYEKSEAVLRILSRLPPPYRFFNIARLVPLFIRDCVYDFIAKRRYGWFGVSDVCRVPTKEERQRFLD